GRARRGRPPAALRVARSRHRLRGAAMGARRSLLRRHAPDRRPAGCAADAQPVRHPDRREQTNEDSLMDTTHFSPLDYVSVIRRRTWWWVTPIVLSIVTGWLL